MKYAGIEIHTAEWMSPEVGPCEGGCGKQVHPGRTPEGSTMFEMVGHAELRVLHTPQRCQALRAKTRT